MEHTRHVPHVRHVPLRDVTAKQFRVRERAAHIGDPGYAPLPDWPVRAIAFRENFDACVNGTFQVHSGSRQERWVVVVVVVVVCACVCVCVCVCVTWEVRVAEQ